MRQPTSFRDLLRRVHRDEEGAVSLETILIIGAIAIPVLIFILRVGWPRIRVFFTAAWMTWRSSGRIRSRAYSRSEVRQSSGVRCSPRCFRDISLQLRSLRFMR